MEVYGKSKNENRSFSASLDLPFTHIDLAACVDRGRRSPEAAGRYIGARYLIRLDQMHTL